MQQITVLLFSPLCFAAPTEPIGTRSSAQGNCSAKSLDGNVVNSSLSSLSSISHAGWGRGPGVGVLGAGGFRGRGLQGEGAGDISSTLPYILHYHMVLCPKGTSHNYYMSSVFPPCTLMYLSIRVKRPPDARTQQTRSLGCSRRSPRVRVPCALNNSSCHRRSRSNLPLDRLATWFCTEQL